MTLQLPPPGASSPDDLAAISHRFVVHAREELDRGNRLQASEKVWGAANYALKAVAAHRAWNHQSDQLVPAIAAQLAQEQDRPDIRDGLVMAGGIHRNFYNNTMEESFIEGGIDHVERLVATLDQIRASAPMPFEVRTPRDANRLYHLTGQTYPIGTRSEIGFIQPRPSGDPGEDTPGGATFVEPPSPTGGSPGGGVALSIPTFGEGSAEPPVVPPEETIHEGLQEENEARPNGEAAHGGPRRRAWRAKARSAETTRLPPAPLGSFRNQRARNSTLPRSPKPPSTTIPKSRRHSGKPAFMAGARR